MKYRLIPIVLISAFLLSFAACSSVKPVLPANEVLKLTSQKLLELGAERYADMQYKEAIYYYSNIIVNYTNVNDQDTESRAWAVYEIGYIYYVNNQYPTALNFFNEVLNMPSPTKAPHFLATQRKDEIAAKMNKK